jgi:hypothetical protein
MFYLPNLLAHPKIDLQKATPEDIRTDEFHPFSGPRSGWTAAVEAQRQRVEQFEKDAAFHARLADEYRRAADSYFAPTPTEGFIDPLPPWLDPEVRKRVDAMTPEERRAAYIRQKRSSPAVAGARSGSFP